MKKRTFMLAAVIASVLCVELPACGVSAAVRGADYSTSGRTGVTGTEATLEPTGDLLEKTCTRFGLPEDTPFEDSSHGADYVRAVFNEAAMNRAEDFILFNADKSIYEGFYADITRDCFWLDGSTGSSYSTGTVNGVPVVVLHLKYAVTDVDEIAGMQYEIDTASNEILANISPDDDCWTKAKVIHDELIRRLTYDQSKQQPYIRSVYSIVTGSAVCEGYAKAFAYLMDSAGEDVRVVTNNRHAWNYVVSYPGNDAFVDVTWDDPDATGSMNGKTFFKYGFFGLTYDEITSYEDHSLTRDRTEGSPCGPSFNYYRRMGAAFDYWDYDSVRNALAAQYSAGNGNLSMQFTNEAAYESAVNQLFGNDCETVGNMLLEIGYEGAYSYLCSDTDRTVTILV